MHSNTLSLSSILLLSLIATELRCQELILSWTFETKDRILSSPLLENQIVYFGSEDGNFYAVDASTGEELWHFNTRGRIQSSSTIADNVVFFESGNTFYALDKATGKELWNHDPGWALWGYKIDPYDDKRSKAIVHDGVFYVGSSLGWIFGFNILTGEKVFSIHSEHGKPIRATPYINKQVLYFADWAGKVYAYDLSQKKYLWKVKTYEEKPYDTFGGIVSELLIHEDKLIFGARNPELKALNIEDGNTEWSYADSTGGWIIGDPVIENDILYIGGSDNYKMFAFNVQSGRVLWDFNSKLNIYTKPIITKKYVIFTTGNAYDPERPGKLFVINKQDGSTVVEKEIPKAIFSSPAWDGTHIYFGAYDGLMYKYKLSK